MSESRNCVKCGSEQGGYQELCADCYGSLASKNRERDAHARAIIREIWDRLDRLQKMICPPCAKDEPMACEMVNLWHPHIVGNCDAWQFRLISTALDDLRDEHFNTEFNPLHERRLGQPEGNSTFCPVCRIVRS